MSIMIFGPESWVSKLRILMGSDPDIPSGIINRRQEYNYNKVMFEQQFNQWKNEQKNN